MPVTITIPDPLVDAITERRGSEPFFDQLAELIDHGFHYSPITYPNPPDPYKHITRPVCPVTDDHIPITDVVFDDHAKSGSFYVINPDYHKHQ